MDRKACPDTERYNGSEVRWGRAFPCASIRVPGLRSQCPSTGIAAISKGYRAGPLPTPKNSHSLIRIFDSGDRLKY